MENAGRRVVIVGASAAGLRCACRLARLRPNWSVTVVEQRESFSYAACGLPYVLAGDIDDPAALRRTSDGALRDQTFFAAAKGVTVLAAHRAEDVDVAGCSLIVADAGGAPERLEWDDLVLATGARARKLCGQPDHPRVRSFHVLEDLEPLHAGLRKGQISRVVIVGSGLVGCELCEAFRALWGVEVTLLEAAVAPLPRMVDSEIGTVVGATLRRNGVDVHTGVAVDGIAAGADAVEVKGGGARFAGDVVVVAVGVEPNVALARKAGVSLGFTGAVVVDERLATSVPHIWAVGDCIEVCRRPDGAPIHLPLGSLANRQGRVLANVLAGRDDRFEGAAGATAAKVFELNVAATGVTRTMAEEHGMAAKSVWVTAHDRAHYWPEAKEIIVHLVYEAASRRVLGVQAVGEGEVAKRIDVATQLVARGASIDELANIEHAYAPPFAPAIDPLAKAAFAAQNQEDGVEATRPDEALAGLRLLDVRHHEERQQRPLPAAAAAMPIEELRAALPLHGDGPWVTVCERGTRSAEAVRLLHAAGELATYLGGGARLRALMGLESDR
jgi:NADPH-dependent 2,4-dienoyl-CoA reductase/sulfur reductase-like enzyme/rhodanese-related sulfurtransferase